MQRLFIALEIPDNIRDYIWDFITEELRQVNMHVSWVKPENMHITLKFLGDTDEEQIDDIKSQLDTVFSDVPKLESSLGKLGTFGGRNPRVVWIEPEGGVSKMKALAKDVNISLDEIGIQRDTRKFSAHLTLGRIRDKANPRELFYAIEKVQYKGLEFTIDRAVLMRSILTPKGAIYEPIEIWYLG